MGGIVSPKLLGGVVELKPKDQRIMQTMIKKIEEVYMSHGYSQVDTALLHLSEVLLAKSGGDTEKQVFRLDNGGRDLSLRFDLTVPLSRYVVANSGDIAFPFMAYQIGKSFRGEKPQRGRFREFYQSDIDIIGRDILHLNYDAEIIITVIDVLRKLGIRDFTIRLNHRKILTGLCVVFGIDNEVEQERVMQAIDKLPKIGVKNTIDMLNKSIDIPDEKLKVLMSIVLKYVNSPNLVSALSKLRKELNKWNDLLETGFQELMEILGYLNEQIDLDSLSSEFNGKIVFDTSIVRGLDYYTGLVMETTLDNYAEVGSICSGGRYDNLSGCFSASSLIKSLPGIGASIGLSRLFYILNEQNLINRDLGKSLFDILVIPMDGMNPFIVETVRTLRDAGLCVQIANSKQKFRKKLDYANKSGVPFIMVFGESELKDKSYTLKYMYDSVQYNMSSIFDVLELIKFKLEEFRLSKPVDM